MEELVPNRPTCAACVQSGPTPLTAPEAVVIIIVLILASALALAGMPSISVIVLLTEATTIGVKLARRVCGTNPAVQGVN